MPRETAAVSARFVLTIKPCTRLQSHFMQSHRRVGCMRVYNCDLPPALLAEWPGSFTCYCSNTGVERTPKCESAEKDSKLTLEKNSLLPLLPGLAPVTFRSGVRRCTAEPSPLPATFLPTSVSACSVVSVPDVTQTLFSLMLPTLSLVHPLKDKLELANTLFIFFQSQAADV